MTEPADSPSNAHEYSVSEISTALKRTVEENFGNVRVRGEISGYRGPHSSGHAYFSLKDDRARIEAVVWKGTFGKLKFQPEEGMEVIATGKLTTYPGSSKYQIVIESMEPAGAGALMALLEERKRRLAAEGLFDAGRKQLLPFMPAVIGVVTSPTGAVIRDIIHRIADRFPLHIVVWPVRVQGETAGAEVAAAVAGFNALPQGGPIARPDIIIVARGGGSLEDLWGFNDEIVVRAVAASGIPVISAVGHETDWTLIDFAADVRAPTPTGAAEMAVPVRADLQATMANLAARLSGCMSRSMDRKQQALRAAARALPSPDQLFALPRRRFDEAAGRITRALLVNTGGKRARLVAARLQPGVLTRRLAEGQRRATRAGERLPGVWRSLAAVKRARFERDSARVTPAALRLRLKSLDDRLSALGQRRDRAALSTLQRFRTRLSQGARLVDSLSVKAVLDRGFALVHDMSGDRLLKRAAEVDPGMRIEIQFADGRVPAVPNGHRDVPGAEARHGEASKPKPKVPAVVKPVGGQGSLF